MEKELTLKNLKARTILTLVLLIIGTVTVIVSFGVHLRYNLPLNHKEKIVIKDTYNNNIVSHYYSGIKSAGVMIFHGFSEEKSSMDGYVSAFNRFGYHVISTDLLGHGQSGGVFNTSEYYYDSIANQILLVKEEFKSISGLSDNEIYLIGHSYGGEGILRAATIDTNIGASLILIGLSIDVESVAFETIPWLQTLNPTNPQTNISIISGEFDDILNPRKAQLLYEVLTGVSVTSYNYVTITPDSNRKSLHILDNIIHTYEVCSPKVIQQVFNEVSILQGESELSIKNIKPFEMVRLFSWLFIIIGMLIAITSGAIFTYYLQFKPFEQIKNEDFVLQNYSIDLRVSSINKYYQYKPLIILGSYLLSAIIIGLIALIPIGNPIFAVPYPIVFFGFGVFSLILYSKNKMPGITGNFKIKEIFNFKSIKIKGLIISILLTLVIASILAYFFSTGWYFVFPRTIRIFWFFLYSILAIPGFYFLQLEDELFNDKKYTMLNVLILLAPIIIGVLILTILGVFFVVFEVIHGMIIYTFIVIFAQIIKKLINHKLLTSILASLLLMFIIIPKGPVLVLL